MSFWQKENYQLKEELEYNSKSLQEAQTRLESMRGLSG
jgi:hypothetical protein